MKIKRVFDFCFSLVILIIFSPILFVVSVLVYFDLGGPVFFTQERVGKNNKTFKMMKFRSMRNSTDKKGKLLSDEERLTSFGRVLRSTSVDELPELFNILKGDMSLIGPRPLLVEYLLYYNEKQKKRHDVLPGLTGWAQINGRNTISWSEKFALDVWYVENWSLSLDIKIFFLTIYKVLKREGINQAESITMEKFNGNN